MDKQLIIFIPKITNLGEVCVDSGLKDTCLLVSLKSILFTSNALSTRQNLSFELEVEWQSEAIWIIRSFKLGCRG